MKIVACVKAVPTLVDPSTVLENRGFFPLSSRNVFMNESDEYTVEEALILRGQVGGEIVVLSMGLAAGQEPLYKALAKGVDRALRVDASFLNPMRTALSLAAVIKREGYDLILTGVESSDVMASCVAGRIASWLEIPFAFAVTGIELIDEKRLSVTKEIGGGKSRKFDIQLPAVLSVQPGICPLSYISYSRFISAKRRPVEIIKLGDLGMEEELENAREWVIQAIYIPEEAEKRSIVMLKGSCEEGVRRLIEIVKNKMLEV